MKDVAFQKLLASVILDNKYDRYVKNRKTGKLDTNSVYKINHSAKLFKKREARKNKDYSVSLVVDCSGSMSGSKIRNAAKSAQNLSHHLCKIGVPNNVVIFHTGVHEIKPFGIKEKKGIEKEIIDEVHGERKVYWFDIDKKVKNVNGGKDLYKFIGLTNSWREYETFREDLARRKIKYNRFEGPGYNSDAEALRIAREFLLKQKGSKIMIFLSDGQPAPLPRGYESPVYEGTDQRDYDLKHEVNVTIATGIELYSIGIQSDAVTRYYPKKRTRVIGSSDALYENIIELVKKNLKRG